MVEDYQIDAWLGGVATELDAEQRAEFGRIVRAYEAIQASRREETAVRSEQDDAAWTAAFEHVIGTLDVGSRGRAYRNAQHAAYAGAVIAVLTGMSELEAARRSTIPRMTLRKALGK